MGAHGCFNEASCQTERAITQSEVKVECRANVTGRPQRKVVSDKKGGRRGHTKISGTMVWFQTSVVQTSRAEAVIHTQLRHQYVCPAAGALLLCPSQLWF